MSQVWNEHYKKDKSKLIYPDENLVRILSKIQPPIKRSLDYGCGSGRHAFLLESLGYEVFACDISEKTIQDLKQESETIQFFLASGEFPNLPTNEFGLILSWGVLHYNHRTFAEAMVNKIHSWLTPGGYLVGSIRADKDTHLQLEGGQIGLEDLKGGYAETYSLEAVKGLLKDFRNLQIGYSERTPLGQLEHKISHWFFLATK